MAASARPGQCQQCWHHAHVVHNWWSRGYVPGPCAPCENHAKNGCPGQPKFQWW